MAALLYAMIFMYGCTLAWVGLGAGVGAGTYKYIHGGVEKNYTMNFGAAWEAVNTALSNQYISVTKSSNEDFRGRIEAVRMDGKKVTVRFRDNMHGLISINIRIGFFGSYEDSVKLHEEISEVAGLK
jgi:hypothetical protein